MMRLYVAGNYSTNAQGNKATKEETYSNIEIGTSICAGLIDNGYAVFCPWLDHQFESFNIDLETSKLRANSIEWLKCSDCVLVISGQGLGQGVDKEIEIANEIGIPIYYNLFDIPKV